MIGITETGRRYKREVFSTYDDDHDDLVRWDFLDRELYLMIHAYIPYL